MEATLLTLLGLLGNCIKYCFTGRQLANNEKQAAKLISESITELLTSDPNLLSVEAKLSKAAALLPNPTGELLQAQNMLSKSKSYAKKTAKKAVKKAAAKKAAKKKSAKIVTKRVTGKKSPAIKKKVATKRSKTTRRASKSSKSFVTKSGRR